MQYVKLRCVNRIVFLYVGPWGHHVTVGWYVQWPFCCDISISLPIRPQERQERQDIIVYLQLIYLSADCLTWNIDRVAFKSRDRYLPLSFPADYRSRPLSRLAAVVKGIAQISLNFCVTMQYTRLFHSVTTTWIVTPGTSNKHVYSYIKQRLIQPVICRVQYLERVLKVRSPRLWASGQDSWLQNGDVFCFLWGTNWIYICYVEESPV
jgi:hypothetical protein